MNKFVLKFALSPLVLLLGIAQTPLIHADDCSSPEFQSLLKRPVKDNNVIRRIDELNLTPAQKKALKPIQNKFDAENKRLGEEMNGLRKKSFEMLSAKSHNQVALNTLFMKMKTNVIAGQTLGATFRHDLYVMLDDKQKNKYHALQQQERQFFRMGIFCPDMQKKINRLPKNDPYDSIDKLNLTNDQKTKIMALINDNRNQEKKILINFDDSSMSVNQMEEQVAQNTAPINSTKLNEFAVAQADSLVKLMKNRFMTNYEIYQALNPKQQKEFVKLLINNV